MGRPLITHCKNCGIKLDITNMVNVKYQGKSGFCRTCYNEKARKKYHEKGGDILRNYGITIEEYDKMFELQSGGCAICKQKCPSGKKLAVDHNHETNEFRGLLCVRCNTALGSIQEDEDLIWNMLEYLKRTTWKKDEVA